MTILTSNPLPFAVFPPVSFVQKFNPTSSIGIFAGSAEAGGDIDGPAISTARFTDLQDIAYTWDAVQRHQLNAGNRFYVIDDQKIKLVHLCGDTIDTTINGTFYIPQLEFAYEYPTGDIRTPEEWDVYGGSGKLLAIGENLDGDVQFTANPPYPELQWDNGQVLTYVPAGLTVSNLTVKFTWTGGGTTSGSVRLKASYFNWMDNEIIGLAHYDGVTKSITMSVPGEVFTSDPYLPYLPELPASSYNDISVPFSWIAVYVYNDSGSSIFQSTAPGTTYLSFDWSE